MSKGSANLRRNVAALAAMLGSFMAVNLGQAAELTVLSPQAMKPALSDLIPQYERMSGNKVSVYYSSTSTLVKEIQDGEVADLAILYPQQIEQLQNEGEIVEGKISPSQNSRLA